MTVIFFRILILKWYSVFLFWESFTAVNFNVLVIHTLIIVIFSCRRSVSDMNTNDQSDIDSVLEGISTQLAQIDSNIGDVNTYLNYPSWCFINLLSLSLGKQILLCCHPQSIKLGLTQSDDVLALSDKIILVSMVLCKWYQIPSVYSTSKPNNKKPK